MQSIGIICRLLSFRAVVAQGLSARCKFPSTRAARVRSPPTPMKLSIAILSANLPRLGGEGNIMRKPVCLRNKKFRRHCEVRQNALGQPGGLFLALKPSHK
ncbi:unnamed protein product [Parnassius mnemosyne]|uniref:Secreted protein n=1 Tax=Parnassius mnemosyne TaxID=213953 RepID=A0AAV1LLZ0_9NEOP